jgi:hypothetical protein
VGTFFGLLSNDVMEAQEAAMQKRLLVVAKKMDGLLVDMHNQFQDFRKRKTRELFRSGCFRLFLSFLFI